MIHFAARMLRVETLTPGRGWYGRGPDVGARWVAASLGGVCPGPDHDEAGWCPVDTHEVVLVGMEVAACP